MNTPTLSSDVAVSRRTFALFDGGERALPDLCAALSAAQREEWAELREGSDALAAGRIRDISCSGFSVRLQYNPRRIINSLADVTDEGTGRRPCFLCPESLPGGQRGILYRGEYLILCNPRPLFPAHFTVAHTGHRPQSILAATGHFLDLMRDLGPEWVTLYNGPQCGASAPDHLHFQVIPAGSLPLEAESREEARVVPLRETNGTAVCRLKSMGREVVILRGRRPDRVAASLARFLEGLAGVLHTGGEPMVNIAGWSGESGFRFLVFPRRKHRPAAFFAKGEDRIVISPAAVEMGGHIVTPVEGDFRRLGREHVEAILAEVSLDEETVLSAVAAMG